MSPQENQLLQEFLQQLQNVKLSGKDPEVAALIAKAGEQQADALYLLVQRALLQDQAMQAAQLQISQLQAEVAKSKNSSSGSFFGNSGAWGNSSTSNSASPVSSNMALANTFASPATSVPPANSSFFGGNAGSLLGTVAAAAAGVAAGAFLFQGLGSLMGGSQHAPTSESGVASAAATPQGNDQGFTPNSFPESSSALADAGSIDSAGFDDLADFSEE
jgi:hypothetical protein